MNAPLGNLLPRRTRGNHRWISYPEERAPCGEAGLRAVYLRRCYDLPEHLWPSLDDCLVSRPRRTTLVVWEPIFTKAPAPPKAAPHCCYIQTIIFYHAPHIIWPWPRLYRAGGRLRVNSGPTFAEWDQVETRLTHDDLVEFDGAEFRLGGGRVVWAKRRWWMLHVARLRERRAAA